MRHWIAPSELCWALRGWEEGWWCWCLFEDRYFIYFIRRFFSARHDIAWRRSRSRCLGTNCTNCTAAQWRQASIVQNNGPERLFTRLQVKMAQGLGESHDNFLGTSSASVSKDVQGLPGTEEHRHECQACFDYLTPNVDQGIQEPELKGNAFIFYLYLFWELQMHSLVKTVDCLSCFHMFWHNMKGHNNFSCILSKLGCQTGL